MVENYGLIGHPLGHSYSQKLFEDAYNGRYGYFMLDLESLCDLRDLIKEKNIKGFNVTIPYKRAIAGIVERMTEEATEIGAVNCVRVESDGSLTGHNTDAEAFYEQLASGCQKVSVSGRQKALILGTGGAARAVAYALKRMGMEYRMVSRRPEGEAISYEDAYAMADDVRMIVNATPVGMWPDVEGVSWMRTELLTRRHLVYDLVYNPSPTRLIQAAAERGAYVMDGMGMLRRQAELSWRFWGINGR